MTGFGLPNTGDLVSVEIDGVMHTERYADLVNPKPDPMARCQAMTANTLAVIERLTAEPPFWRRVLSRLRRVAERLAKGI